MMKPVELFSRLAHLLSVPKCVCCGEKLSYGQRALCTECSLQYKEICTRNCSRCARLLSQCSCSTPYLEAHYIKRFVKVFRYQNREDNIPANSLIYSLKKDNRSDVLQLCTEELTRAFESSDIDVSSCIITNVPRRKAQIVKYGIDHAELLAREIAKLAGGTYMKLLRSNVKTAQKEQYGKARETNIDFEIIRDIDLSGKTVIIVDDIVTTGASMGGAAMLIRGLGTKRIIGATLAIAYKEFSEQKAYRN